MLLSVDPGLRACGCALFAGQTLVAAELVAGSKDLVGPDAWIAMAHAVTQWVYSKRTTVNRVAFEQPCAYRSDTPRRTLLLQDLVAVCGALCATMPFAVRIRYFPHEWQGRLKRPKNPDQDPVIQRIKGRLSAEEMARVRLPARSLQHNVWDAAGVGLKLLGRFEPVKYVGRG